MPGLAIDAQQSFVQSFENTRVKQQYMPRQTNLVPESDPTPSDPRSTRFREVSNTGDDPSLQDRRPKCVGCIRNGMQLIWLDTLMTVSGNRKLLGGSRSVDEHPLSLLTRRWIVAEERGFDLVSYTGGLVAHETSLTCLDVPRLMREYFSSLPPPQPYEDAKHDIGQVKANDYFGPFAAHLPPDDDNRGADSEIPFRNPPTSSRMSTDGSEALESPEAFDAWEELGNDENMEEDAAFDFPELEHPIGIDTSWEHIEPPMTPSMFLPSPNDPSWADFNTASDELAKSGTDVGRKRSCAMEDQQQDENAVEKRIRLDDPST